MGRYYKLSFVAVRDANVFTNNSNDIIIYQKGTYTRYELENPAYVYIDYGSEQFKNKISLSKMKNLKDCKEINLENVEEEMQFIIESNKRGINDKCYSIKWAEYTIAYYNYGWFAVFTNEKKKIGFTIDNAGLSYYYTKMENSKYCELENGDLLIINNSDTPSCLLLSKKIPSVTLYEEPKYDIKNSIVGTTYDNIKNLKKNSYYYDERNSYRVVVV